MKHRIRELFKRAGGKTTVHNLASNPVQYREYNELWDDRIEKFAELIVRECVQFIEEENVRLCEYQNSLPDWEGNKRDDCDLVIEKCIDLAERMKTHFGVE